MIALALLLCQAESWPRPEEIEQVRTRTAYTLDAGEIEVDVVGSQLRFDEDGVKRDEAALIVEVEAGLTDWLQVEVEIPYRWLDPGERGWGDVELELKAALPGDWEGIEAALGVEVGLPTGDEDHGLGAPEAVYGAYAAFSRRFDAAALHLEFAAELSKGAKPEYEAAAALDWMPWGRGLSLLLALNAEFEPEEDAAWCVVPGFEVRLDEPDLQFGAGFPLGLTEEAEEWGVIVDVEIEF